MTLPANDSAGSGAGLRTGVTTGACAAAAAKAAALALLGERPTKVEIPLPDGGRLTVPVAEATVEAAGVGRGAVVKDSGDDPDATNGMTVVVTVVPGGDSIRFLAGAGVGTVTRHGLVLGVGEPAINPVPRRMIAEALRDVLGDAGAEVTVSIPGGEEVARGTFNGRLGIEGGLSVIGTTGRVVPKSSEAWMRSLLPQVDVAVASGYTTVWLTTGGRGDTFAADVLGAPQEAVVQASNFIGPLLDRCAEAGVERVVLVGHAGKLLKVAAGLFDTHSRWGDARMETVAAIAAAEGAPGPLVARLLDAPTVEAVVGELENAGLGDVWDAVARRVAARSARRCGLPVEAVLVGYHDELLGATDGVAVPGRQRDAEVARLVVVGVGPGGEPTLTPEAWREVRRADIIAGGARQLERFAPDDARRVVVGADVVTALAAIREALADPSARAVVLASGDPGFFGILQAVRRELPDVPARVIPGISSFQVAAARLGVSWHDAGLASAHGRDAGAVVEECLSHARTFALCDNTTPPQRLAALLAERGSFTVTVAERIGEEDERFTSGTASEIANGAFDALSVLVAEREAVSE